MTKIEITKTELVWPGKYDEQGRRAEPPRARLPSQVWDAAISYWCDQVTKLTGTRWRFMRVNQTVFDQRKPVALADLVPALAPPRPASG